MLQGKTTIELTNVRTGEKERCEDHNMITNALNYLFKPIGYHKGNGPHYDVPNICTQYLGGMLLFDKSIDESPNTIYAPSDAEVIGYAAYGYTNDTSDVTIGSCNITETEINASAKYMKLVFDFATSQANGTISCVSLTHVLAAKYAMYGGKGNTISSNPTQPILNGWSGLPMLIDAAEFKTSTFTMSAEHPFLVDATNDVVYYFSVPNTTTLRITMRRGNILSIPAVLPHKTTKELIETKEVSLPADIQTKYVAWNYENDDGYLYICTTSNTSISAGGTFLVTKVKISDWTVEQITVKNNTGSALSSDSNFFAYVHQGLIYLKDSSTGAYIINLSDPTVCCKLSGSLRSSSCKPQVAENGRVYWPAYQYANYGSDSSYLSIANGKKKRLDNPTANYLHSGSSGTYRQYIPYKDDNFHWCVSKYGNCAYLYPYLATINNLARPIEKTADKTMKITYTIQEM